MDKEKTIVIYRTWKDGSVIALFPEIPADNMGLYCSSYMHIGQHDQAQFCGVVSQTRLSNPKEYCDLHRELKQLGYNLIIRNRLTPKMLMNRKNSVADMKI